MLLRRVKDSFTEIVSRPGIVSGAGRRVYNAYYLLGQHLIPSRRYVRRLDHEFDARFGVRTKAMWLGMAGSSEAAQQATGYEASKPSWLKEALDQIEIRFEEFTFIDVGSGMGRILFLASDFPFKKIIGIEFSRELHEITEQNLKLYRSQSQKCRDIESVCVDAAQYQIPHVKTVFYFFNPFGGEMMARILTRIQVSLSETPRDVFILYVNPKEADVFQKFAFTRIGSTRYCSIYKAN